MNKNVPVGKTNAKRSIGIYGESLAADYLLGQGYTILNRNWRCRSGELDIVTCQDSTIVVVEVRTRRAGGRFGTAVESVDFRKQLQVRSTTEVYLSMNKLHDWPIRFDVVALTLVQIASDPVSYEVTELKHIEEAF